MSSCPTVSMQAGQALSVNQRITSCDGRFYLVLQTDENLVLYNNTTPWWASNTEGRSPGQAVMKTDVNRDGSFKCLRIDESDR
jgi:hypothetical protein